MDMFGYYDATYLPYIIISLAVSMYAHFKVKHAFNKYSKIGCSTGLTGYQSAETVLDYNNVSGVSVTRTNGYFTDFFDSRSNSISLSDNVYSRQTIASVSVAAHESGHAVQNARGYFPLKIRQFLAPATQIGSSLAFPLVFIGLLLPVQYSFVVNFGIILFALAVFFQVVTLPVEFNASRIALETIKSTNILNSDEQEGAKSVLKAAALTYVAATFTALLSLLRLIFIASRRNDF
jgi:Zn-dependent membrane protease YugP